jgi:hypothetical protein
MAEITDAQIDAALERGALVRAGEPRAASARYDRPTGRIVVELTNGAAFAFPAGLVRELETASQDQLAQVEILGIGHGLHWDALDTDLTVPGLLAGVFGTQAHLARKAGQATSPAKAAAARSNGTRGGRPRTSKSA